MKKYSGFTLIEMLIVMGIIIILMAAGIAGGRFALQRANRIQKQSAVDNIEQALWGFYTDNRSFPRVSGDVGVAPGVMLSENGVLYQYIDAGQFDGGTDGDFYYFVDSQGQEFVACVSLGGVGDEQQIGIYCTGNGLTNDSVEPFNSATVPVDNIYKYDSAVAEHVTIYGAIKSSDANTSFWNGETRNWE